MCLFIRLKTFDKCHRPHTARMHGTYNTEKEQATVSDATSHSAVKQDKSDAGYAKDLKPRHIQMIAIGGSIGTGLFLGAGADCRRAAQDWQSPTPYAASSRS